MRNDNATSRLKSVFVTTDKEMESQLRGVSSGQPQLFAEIARCHDLRALPEHIAFIFTPDNLVENCKTCPLRMNKQPALASRVLTQTPTIKITRYSLT
jgi:hypothetical protein